MGDLDFPRVVTREKRSGTTRIRGTAKGIGAFVGRTLRGPLYPVLVDGPTKLERLYGTDDPNSALVTSVKKFFKAGGRRCWVQRVVGSGGGSNTKGTVTLVSAGGGAATAGSIASGAAAFPVRLPAGTTFTGSHNGGGAVTATVTATKAFRTGAAATYAAGAGGDSVTILIPAANGGIAQVIDTSTAGASQASYLALINASLEGGRAIDSGGQIRIETDQAGSGAAGSITAFGGAAAAKTGLSVGAFTAGTGNVANDDAVTAAEFVAMCTAAAIGGTFAAPTATSVTWTSSTTGPASTVQWTAGSGVALVTGFDLVSHAGSASAAVDVLRFESIGPGTDNNGFSARVSSQDSRLATGIPALVAAGPITQITLGATASRLLPGDTVRLVDSTTSTTARGTVKLVQGTRIVFTGSVTLSGNLTAANTQVILETFTATILHDGAIMHGPRVGLRTSSLSARNYFGNVYNVLGDQDAIVSVVDLGATGSFDLRPTNTDLANGDAFTGGSEATTFADVDYIGTSGAKTGFYGLDRKKNFSMIACPGVTGITPGAVSRALHEYASAREDCVAITSTPAGLSPSAAKAFITDNHAVTSYAAIYWPWPLSIGALSGVSEPTPPEGYAMGKIAHTHERFPISRAPAGEDIGPIPDVTGFEYDVVDGDADVEALHSANVNVLLNLEEFGPAVWGARTYESGEFNSLHIRLGFIYLRTSMQRGTRFAVFLNNDEDGRQRVFNALDDFLYAEWKAKTLSGQRASDAYTVQCDKDNNGAEVIAAKRMDAEVSVHFAEMVENLVISISQKQPEPAQAA